MQANQPAFYYHTSATALGGSFEQPKTHFVSPLASIALGEAGGFSAKRIERFNLDGLISVDSAHVRVAGTEHGRYPESGGWRTIATAAVEGLNVLEVVTADRIVAQVSILHAYDEGPAQVSLLGTRFDNLRVNGSLVTPEIDRRLFGGHCQSTEGEQEGYAAGEDQGVRLTATTPEPLTLPDIFRIAESQYLNSDDSRSDLKKLLGARAPTRPPSEDIEVRGSAVCSLVTQAPVPCPSINIGRVIHVPDFGNIFLGEILVGRFSIDMTMMRIELGCMAKGTLGIASFHANGRPMP